METKIREGPTLVACWPLPFSSLQTGSSLERIANDSTKSLPVRPPSAAVVRDTHPRSHAHPLRRLLWSRYLALVRGARRHVIQRYASRVQTGDNKGRTSFKSRSPSVQRGTSDHVSSKVQPFFLPDTLPQQPALCGNHARTLSMNDRYRGLISR